MKQLFLLTFFLPLISFAQIAKKDMLIGGNLDLQFSSTKYSTYKQSIFTFSVNPSVSGFLTKNIALGGNISYFASSINSAVSGTKSTNFRCGFSAGPQLREYVKISNLLYFMGHQGINFGVGRTLYSSDKTQPFDRNIIINFKIGPGLAFLIKKNILLETGVYYRADLIKSQLVQKNTVLSSTNFIATHNILFNIGFNFLLNHQSKK